MHDLTPKQQAIELIRQAKSILVVSHKNPDGDSLGSMLALKIALEKLEKKVDLACPDLPSKLFSFLPKIETITEDIDYVNEFIISLDTSKSEIEKLGYKKDIQGNKVDIVITAKSGSFSQTDVSFKNAGSKYDLIVVLDTPNLERLGKLASPADLFYETPSINIDHHPSNERFGKVNWIELVATSTSEILVSLIEALSKDKQLIDEDIATALLAGLIYDTSSFQNINTTPKSLTVAAQLVASGARQQEIVRNFYKTKSLETLKLWGFILSGVKEDKKARFIWSSVTKADMEAVGADENALSGVVDELLKSATDVDFAMLLSERDGDTHGSLRSIAKGFDVAQIAEAFGGGGHEVAAAFRIEGSIKENEENILLKIRHLMSKEKEVESRSEILESKTETKAKEDSITDIAEDRLIEENKVDKEEKIDEKSPLEIALDLESEENKKLESISVNEQSSADLGFTVVDDDDSVISSSNGFTGKTKW